MKFFFRFFQWSPSGRSPSRGFIPPLLDPSRSIAPRALKTPSTPTTAIGSSITFFFLTSFYELPPQPFPRFCFLLFSVCFPLLFVPCCPNPSARTRYQSPPQERNTSFLQPILHCFCFLPFLCLRRHFLDVSSPYSALYFTVRKVLVLEAKFFLSPALEVPR